MATYAELAQRARAALADLAARRQEQADIILNIRSRCEDEQHRDPTDEEAQEVRAAVEVRAQLDEQLTDQRERVAELEREAEMENIIAAEARSARTEHVAPGVITSEPSVYNRGSASEGVSFFRDLYSEQFRGGRRGASERLNRYRAEIDTRQERAGTMASFAGLIPPDYLVDDAAPVARAGRPMANTVRRLPLPPEGEELVIPRGVTGAAVAVQATENTAVEEQDEDWANLNANVVTISGQQPVSRQSLERGIPGIDGIIFQDLAAAYAVALDAQVAAGSGTSGQALGVLNTAGIGVATAFGAAAAAQSFITKVGGAINQVQTNRFAAPGIIWMHPRRWNWLTVQVDGNQRPLVVPQPGVVNAFGIANDPADPTTATSVGEFLGLPVVLDANLPTNFGTGSDEDVVVVARNSDLLLWEDGDGSPTDLTFEQTLGQQLTVTLVAYGYMAFTAGRYPGASAIVGGQDAATKGLVAPTF